LNAVEYLESNQAKKKIKFMKLINQKIITVLALGGFLAFSPTSRAQDTNAPTPPASGAPANHVRGGNYVKQLDLTADQQPKFKTALESMMQQTKAVRQDTSLTPEDKRAKLKAIREQTNESLKSILTPEQYEKWLKMAPGVRHPRPTPPPVSNPAANPPAAQ
jgi:Spy/CpxP family protein refolding chaperone